MESTVNEKQIKIKYFSMFGNQFAKGNPPNKTSFKKGMTSWNKGKKYLFNEKHPLWKGDNAGYTSLHIWLRKNYPPPKSCQRCGIKKKRLELSCNGKYSRNIEDYEYICKKCHFKKDGIQKVLVKHGEECGRSKLTKKQVIKIRKLYKTGLYSQTKLGKMYGVVQGTIRPLLLRKTWKHL